MGPPSRARTLLPRGKPRLTNVSLPQVSFFICFPSSFTHVLRYKDCGAFASLSLILSPTHNFLIHHFCSLLVLATKVLFFSFSDKILIFEIPQTQCWLTHLYPNGNADSLLPFSLHPRHLQMRTLLPLQRSIPRIWDTVTLIMTQQRRLHCIPHRMIQNDFNNSFLVLLRETIMEWKGKGEKRGMGRRILSMMMVK